MIIISSLRRTTFLMLKRRQTLSGDFRFSLCSNFIFYRYIILIKTVKTVGLTLKSLLESILKFFFLFIHGDII